MDGDGAGYHPSLLEAELYRASWAAASLYPGSDVPIMQEEMAREIKEEALTPEDREEKAFTCLLLARRRMGAHRGVFKQVIEQKSSELGMRHDDILVALIHSMWASCYNTSLSMDTDTLASLSQKEAEALLTSNPPGARFSQQMLQQLDKAIERLATHEPAQTSSSSAPTALFVLLPFVVFGLLLFALQRLFRGTGQFAKDEQAHEDHTNVPNGAVLKGGDPQEATTRRRMSEGSTRGPTLRGQREGPVRAS
ncbi:hypothetical protein Efla_001355 [Eimeria flavescens]